MTAHFDPAAVRALEPDYWRAPSAHNTQPWTLTYHADRVEIGWDPECALPVADPTGRDLMLALGAFTECCLIVCAAQGLSIGFAHDAGERRIGRLVPADAPYATPFTVDDIQRRTSHRGDYRPGPIDDVLFARLMSCAESNGMQLQRLSGRALRPLLARADHELFRAPATVRELRQWLRLTPRHRRYRLDGLTDRALALSRAEAHGLRWALAAYPVLRYLGLARLLAASARGPLDGDGEVLVLIGPSTAADQVEAGRVLFRILLTLAGAGYATHPLSQLIDVADTRAGVAELVQVADPERLLHIARSGLPATPPVRSHRRRG